MTRPTVPAVSAEAQAVLDIVVEEFLLRLEALGAVVTLFGEAIVAAYKPALNALAEAVDLPEPEATPAPSPVLPPIPEPGPYLDNHGQLVELGKLGVRWAGELDWKFWDHVQPYGPFTRLRPGSEVVDRADAQELAAKARDWAVYLCNHEHINHQETAEADFEACNQDECPDRRALLARVDALGVTA